MLLDSGRASLLYLFTLGLFSENASATVESPYVFNPPTATQTSQPYSAATPTYNYCNMPHVHKDTYIVPDSFYTLKYVEVIHRHHLRTPYASNTFPREEIAWQCDKIHPRHYSRTSFGAGSDAAAVQWSASFDPANPFYSATGFAGSNCLFPQLSDQGLEDSVTHGADLRAVYHDLLGFLPASASSENVKFRVTNNDITGQVLGGVLAGLYPGTAEIVVDIQDSSFDSLEPTYSCPKADSLKAAIRSSPLWSTHLSASSSLFSKLDSISSIKSSDSGWHTSWDHYFDNLSSKQCHGKTLPCSVSAEGACVSQAEADQVYALGQWEYAYQFRQAPESFDYSRLKYGAFMLELKSHLMSASSGTSGILYRHNVAHDGSLSPLFGLLKVKNMVWPGMGAEVAFELFEKSRAYFVRVLWGGVPMETDSSMGVLDMIPLDSFLQYIDSTVPADLVEACNN